MSFTVDAAGLAGLPEQLDRLQLDAFRGSAFVGDHTRLAYGGVLNDISAEHENVVHEARGFLDKLGGPVAGNTAEAVRAALTYYVHTDAKAAAALDATYPATTGEHAASLGVDGSTSYSSSARGARFRDVAAPSEHYLAPPDYDTEFPDQPSALDCVGPASLGRQLIIHGTELAASLGLGHRWDPYEAVLQPLTGDWSGLRACADVFANAGAAVGDMEMNLRTTAYDVPEVWTGNAADGATGHLLRVADQLGAARQPFADLASAYKTAAQQAHAQFDQLAHQLDDLLDIVLVFIVEAGMAAATSETGVGALALGAASAVTGFEIYKVIHLITLLIKQLEAQIHNFDTLLNGSAVVGLHLKLPALDPAHLQLPGDQSGVGKTKIGPAR
jgi:hypothetical protein